MDKKPSRRQYIATLGVVSIAGVAGCSQINSEQTATPSRNLGGANFTFEYNSQAQQATIQYNGGATIQAGNLQVRSSSGMQTEWSQLGSTMTGADAQLSTGATAVLGADTLNWGQAVGPSETIRLVYEPGNGPSTLGRFTPTESSTTNDAEIDGTLFADDFESGELTNWNEVVVPDSNNQDVVDWGTTQDAISGSYSAYCETIGDANHLRTQDAVLNFDSSFSISLDWQTNSPDSRGMSCKVTNGLDGEDFETLLFVRVGLDVDDNPRVQLDGQENSITAVDYNMANELTVQIQDSSEVTVLHNGTEVVSGTTDISGEKYLTLNSSGHYGYDSSMTVDNITVEPL